MVIDSSRIRRKILGECNRARTNYRRAEAELHTYETKDKPAYHRWYRTEFGPKIEILKTHIDACNRMDELIIRLDRFARLMPCSPQAAYRMHQNSPAEFERQENALRERLEREQEKAWQKQREHEANQQNHIRQIVADYLNKIKKHIPNILKQGVPPFAILSELLNFLQFGEGINTSDVLDALYTDEGRALLASFGLAEALDQDVMEEVENMHRRTGFDSGQAQNDTRDESPSRDGAATSPTTEARIKALFRELAFALHPDQSGSHDDPSRLNLWHQVQEAMANRDLDQLEVLHAHMQVLRGELSPHTAVSRLLSLIQMYRNSRNALRRKIRSLRIEQAWGFSSVGSFELSVRRKWAEKELGQKIYEAEQHLKAAKHQFEKVFAAPEKSSKKTQHATMPGQFTLFD